MQPIDPGNLAQGVGGDEDHHEADGTAGSAGRREICEHSTLSFLPGTAP
jgi:hypothetical protein